MTENLRREGSYGNVSLDQHEEPAVRSTILATMSLLLTCLCPALAFAAAPASGADGKIVLWDGHNHGQGTPTAGDKPTTDPAISISYRADARDTGAGAIAVQAEGPGMIGGWWQLTDKPGAGVDINGSVNLVLQLKVEGKAKPQAVFVRLHDAAGQLSTALNVADYIDGMNDGQWHEVVLPLKDFLHGQNGFSATTFDGVEFRGFSWVGPPKSFVVLVSAIALDNRPSHGRFDPVPPVARQPRPVAADAPAVTAEVDITDAGKPISPLIYGAACDGMVARATGLTIVRQGGNTASTGNWKGGFWSSGGDWYNVNNPAKFKPAPAEERFKAFGELKKMGLELYQTIPIMGRVAKDGTSVGFDINKYPDQTTWEGKDHPGDQHPNAGSGVQYVRDEKGEIKKDAHGRPVTRLIPPNPDDVSIEMSPDEQCQELEFEVRNEGFGAADKGGIKYVCLDNEPMIWHSTHPCFHPLGCGYDEYWQRTVEYAGRLKKIDPSVKIAGPATFGWTDLFYSGLDSQLVSQGKGTWKSPPDYTAHGKVPFLKWWMKQLNAYEKEQGVRLIDILDFHFYAQVNNRAGSDARTMEDRVQETRIYWDPIYKDPSWIGAETAHIIQVIPLLKEWIAECNPGMLTSIGEYSMDGGDNISGGVAEAELLGIFAREGLDMAFLWGEPTPNSSIHFGFAMLRNPDGKFTSFGDRYLPAKVDAPTDVSVHTARDSASGRISFVLVNKRGAKDARVTLKLNKPIPEQKAVFYEYSAADRRAIGQLPAHKVGGDRIAIDLPAMSVLRFDVVP